MSDIKMCDDNILYCLQTISSFEPDDIECDDFDIAVNDDQFAQMSIVRSAELGVELIDKLTEQNKMLREALVLCMKDDNCDANTIESQYLIVKKALEVTK